MIDFATIFGLLAGFILVGIAILLGGAPAAFINVPGMFIVLGGTLAVTAISFSVNEMVNAQKILWRTMFTHPETPELAATHVLKLAEQARKKGILGLQSVVKKLPKENFLHKAMELVLDNVPPEEIEALLRADVEAMSERHKRSAGVLRRAGEVSPAMGLIGTLVGLVQMLGNLNDPASIGPAMAVALLTTFYGAVLANMVFLPLANKLDRNSAQETLTNFVYTIAASSITKKENPRKLEIMINSLLPPADHVRYFK